MEPARELVRVDTKSMCLLCLRKWGPGPDEPEHFEKCEGQQRQPSSFLQLLRYLKIDVAQFLQKYSSPINSNKSFDSNDMENGMELAVTLCDGCSSIADHVFELYKKLEMLRLELGKGREQMCEVIQSGNMDTERVAQFRNMFCAKAPEELARLGILEELRMETMEKCSINGTSLEMDAGKEEFVRTECQFTDESKRPEDIVVKVEPDSENFGSHPDHDLSFAHDEDGDGPLTTSTSVIGPSFSAILEYPVPASLSGPPVLNRLACTICGRIFTGKKKLYKHQVSCNGVAWYTCNYCGHRSAKVASHDSHVFGRHPLEVYKGRLPPSCTKQQFTDAARLVVNRFVVRRDNLGREAYGCPKCLKCYIKVNSLRLHIIKCHVGEVIQNLKDLVPGKRVQTMPRTLGKSSSSKSKGKNSSETFTQNAKSSKISSSNSSKIPPPKKIKSIPDPKLLAEEKPFVCAVCGKRFVSVENVDKHMLSMHTAFTLASKLPPGTTENELQSALAPLRKNSCWICKRKSFSGRPTVRNHMLTEHLPEICQILCANKAAAGGASSIEVVTEADHDDDPDTEPGSFSNEPINLNEEIECKIEYEYEETEQKPMIINEEGMEF